MQCLTAQGTGVMHDAAPAVLAFRLHKPLAGEVVGAPPVS